jgi:hypothetical protein
VGQTLFWWTMEYVKQKSGQPGGPKLSLRQTLFRESDLIVENCSVGKMGRIYIAIYIYIYRSIFSIFSDMFW